MSKTRIGHPGAKLFNAAMAGVTSNTNPKKKKPPNEDIHAIGSTSEDSTKQTNSFEVSVSVLPDPYSDVLDMQTLRIHEVDDNYQESAISEKPYQEDDYSLPVMEISPPPGYTMPKSSSLESRYYSAVTPFGDSENTCPPGFAADLPECPDFLQDQCLPRSASAYHPFSSSMAEREQYNSSPHYYQDATQRLEPSSASMHCPPGFSDVPSVYSRPLMYDHDLPIRSVYGDVLDHHSVTESESPQYPPRVSQKCYSDEPSICHSPSFSMVPTERSDSPEQYSSYFPNLGSQYHQFVNQREDNNDVSPYHSPSSAMFNSEHNYLSQSQSHQLNSEHRNVTRHRSQSSSSQCLSASDILDYIDASSCPSQYENSHLSSEVHKVTRQRSQSSLPQYQSTAQRPDHTDVSSYPSQYQTHQLSSEFHEVTRQLTHSYMPQYANVTHRSDSTGVSSYPSPYQSDYLNSELPDVTRQRSQSYASHYPGVSQRLEPSGELPYRSSSSAIVPTEYSTYPSQYPSHNLNSESDLRWRSQSYGPQHPSVSRQSETSNLYAFTVTALTSDPDDAGQISQSVQDLSIESLPSKVPEECQDSGCISSEDGNSSETSPCSTSSDYQFERTSTFPSNRSGSPTEENLQGSEVNAVSVSGRVSRRNVSRIQGSRYSLSNPVRPSQNTCISRQSLPTQNYQYISSDYSDDSGADISTDDELENGCRNERRNVYDSCTGCEEESQRLIQADASNRFRPLPDYAPSIKFLTCKSDQGFIDSHCHLDFLFQRQNFDGSYSEYKLRHCETYPVSYEGCVAVFCNPNTFYRKTMWEKYLKEPDVWGTFGCHPHNANLYNDIVEKDLLRALQHSKVRALGEIGLDYSNRNDCSKETQHSVFRRQLKIALSKKLPLVIHCRDANEDLMKIMKEMLPKNYFIHLHCFTDDWVWAQKWMSEFPNLFIGITNLVTYSSAEPTHDVAKRIPLDRLLLETDAPYFVPRRIPRSTRYSHPGMAIHVAAQIATLRNVSLKEVIRRTRENTRKMYRI